MLALTLGLGIWQLQRLGWKAALLAEIDRGEQAPPGELSVRASAFTRVVVRGEYLPQVARYGAEVRTGPMGPTMGAHVLAPLRWNGGEPVIVDRGWAPLEFDTRPPVGEVMVEGYVRPPEYPVQFGAADDPAGRRFYALDPVAIGASLGVPNVAPFTVVALGRGGTLPDPARALPRPANNHLSYAITWFGLAAGLVVVFAVYARGVMRKPIA